MTDVYEDRGMEPIQDIVARIQHNTVPMDFELSTQVADDFRRLMDYINDSGHVRVPVEPTDGLLMSMAVRADHGLATICIGMTDLALSEARKMHEEVVGRGFYSPEREQDYKAMLSASKGEK